MMEQGSVIPEMAKEAVQSKEVAKISLTRSTRLTMKILKMMNSTIPICSRTVAQTMTSAGDQKSFKVVVPAVPGPSRAKLQESLISCLWSEGPDILFASDFLGC